MDHSEEAVTWRCIAAWKKEADERLQEFRADVWDGPMKAALSALTPGDRLPNGLMVVPVEATEAMARDGAARLRDFYSEKCPYPRTAAMYRAMLEAAVDE